MSVIIPTYNRGSLLPSVLDSVFSQTDCPPFEVVVVDDGSTDDTTDVLQRYAHPLRVVRHERNRGLATSRQTGATHARGRLLAFHDSDDFMLPGRLGKLAAFLGDHPDVGAVYANGIVERDGQPTGEQVVPAILARRLDGRRFGIADILWDGLPVYLQTALVRREAFDAAGGIDPAMVRHADLELTCRISLTARTVFLDFPVFRYQLHGANQTRERLKLLEGLVEAMRRVRTRHPEAVALVGEDRFREREAKHLYQVARARRKGGDRASARAAIREALALEPRVLRYRVESWRIF